MRYNLIILLVLFVCAITIPFLDIKNLPPISLPKGAQHNTLGELPIVEVADDGDFYEKDGEEELYAEAAAGNFTAQWLVFAKENCGSWICDKETNQKFKEMKNKEWGDKMKWLGNQGIFEKGYMEYSRP